MVLGFKQHLLKKTNVIVLKCVTVSTTLLALLGFELFSTLYQLYHGDSFSYDPLVNKLVLG